MYKKQTIHTQTHSKYLHQKQHPQMQTSAEFREYTQHIHISLMNYINGGRLFYIHLYKILFYIKCLFFSKCAKCYLIQVSFSNPVIAKKYINNNLKTGQLA